MQIPWNRDSEHIVLARAITSAFRVFHVPLLSVVSDLVLTRPLNKEGIIAKRTKSTDMWTAYRRAERNFIDSSSLLFSLEIWAKTG